MKLRHLGYACTNVTLGCTTGRTLRLANLTEERAAAVVAENLATLNNLLRWNLSQGIRFFRISSSIVPLASHEAFPFNWRERFAAELADQYLLMQRGEIVMRGRGKDMAADGVKERLAI